VASPVDRAAFWLHVEEQCASDKNFYGGAVTTHPDFREWFADPQEGQHFERRLRATEQACQDQGLGTPETVFRLVGRRQVGKGSLAGMRVLAHFKQTCPDAAIWPFDDIAPARLVIVEIFPTAFIQLARAGVGKVLDLARLNQVLHHYGSQDYGSQETGHRMPEFTDDETDALISAAALRKLSGNSDLWNPEALSDRVRRYEGWTFGIG
jgi:hypothetical protein